MINKDESKPAGPIKAYSEELRKKFVAARESREPAQAQKAIVNNFTLLNNLLHGYNFSTTQKKPNQFFSEKKYEDTKKGVESYIKDLKSELPDYNPVDKEKALKTVKLLQDALNSYDAKNVAGTSKQTNPNLANIPKAFSEGVENLKTIKDSQPSTEIITTKETKSF